VAEGDLVAHIITRTTAGDTCITAATSRTHRVVAGRIAEIRGG
jgi:hypothetical protein